MITSVEIENYKCYADHRVELGPTAVVVGKNNAGKSTLIESLRLVSMVTQRLKGLNYKRNYSPEVPSPKSLQPSLKRTDINLINSFHNYGKPPSVVRANFESGYVVEVFIDEERTVHGLVRDSSGKLVRTGVPTVSVLPQVAPLLLSERILDPDYVRQSVMSSIAYQHFRNQLAVYPDAFERFRRVVQDSWPGLKVESLDLQTGEAGDGISLLVRDTDFAAEIGWMGHGLQIWMQMIWYLVRSASDRVMILDEPDVYLHADLQRRLFRMVRSFDNQVIIATHSVEIIDEAQVEDVVVLDRTAPVSASPQRAAIVQTVLDRIGTTHNIQLSRLWYSRKCIIVEGHDMKLLSIVHRTLYPDLDQPLTNTPNFSIGGWAAWDYAIGGAFALENATGESVSVFCIMDSDYHLESETVARKKQAQEKGIRLKIWSKKEIENYLLVPGAIARIVNRGIDNGLADETTISSLIDECCRSTMDDLVAGFTDSFAAQNRHWTASRAANEARALVDEIASDRETLWNRAPGKKVLSRLSELCKEDYGTSFSKDRVANEIRGDEVDGELSETIAEIVGLG